MLKKLLIKSMLIAPYFLFAGVNDIAVSWHKDYTKQNKPKRKQTFYTRFDLKAIKAQEDNLSYVLDQDISESRSALNPHFDWDFGFRAGFGYINNMTNLEITANWRYINSTGDSSIKLETGHELLPVYTSIGGALIASNAHIRTKMNHLDVNLGKIFNVSSRFTMTTGAGIEYGWIRQDFNINYVLASATATVSNVDRFQGFGPRVFVHAFWKVWKKFGPFGEIDASLLIGKEKVRQAINTDFIILTNEYQMSRFIISYILGLQYAHVFSSGKYGLQFRLGWENAIYFEQNQFITLKTANPASGTFTMGPGDLSYQAWVLGVLFSF